MGPLFILGCCLATILFIVSILPQTPIFKRNYNLPPGTIGWPIIGETFSYFASPTAFIRHKMTKYSTTIFSTYFFGHNVVFLCGPAANKFIFSNEGKLFKVWIPETLSKILCQPNYPKNSELQSSWLLLDAPIHKFFRPDSIRDHVHVIDSVSREHVDRYWVPNTNKELKVYPLAKEFSFYLACRVMLDYSNTNSEQIRQLAKQFFILAEDVFNVPVNFPGTPYYRAKKGGDKVLEMVTEIVKQRRKEATTMSPKEDVLGHILMATDSNGHVYSDQQIARKIIGYLFAGFYSTSSTIAILLCHLAQHPLVFEKVLQEQLEIVKDQREPGKLLHWKDVQKMKYSWNVVRESMRLLPPPTATFRVALTDFTYEGYTIPKGWKIGWDAHYTNTDPTYFKDPEKFDPSRFEEEGASVPYTYVPFGGGPRMCKGNEFARILLLVFLHNVVTKFRLEEIDSQKKTSSNHTSFQLKVVRV
ncbi:beta-amyrin 6-beta-monooxygenase-like [Silene latifolia]|uniref:beta-amyrin 6-beta-monooxygenase-like n=1 Tax=Silene latifolia TaxID=37657 RepID=UPI003D77D118